MTKGKILLALAMAVGMSTAADAQRRPAAEPKMSAQDQSFMFMRDALNPWETTWSSPATAKPAMKKAKRSKMKSKKKRG